MSSSSTSPARICSENGVGPTGSTANVHTSFRTCFFSARIWTDVGPAAVELQTTVRSRTFRSCNARSRSVGHACGGPKEWTSSMSPSRTSATASSAVSQIRFVAIAPDCHAPAGRATAQAVGYGTTDAQLGSSVTICVRNVRRLTPSDMVSGAPRIVWVVPAT